MEASKKKKKKRHSVMWGACVLSHVHLFATPWSVACQAPLSMEFSRQNTGMGHHFLLQGILLTQ